ncbi:hypothetical protein SYNPS1DRAFT_27100 [Syncephalis pseudoplumigaleata]|uniref:Secreted protein n=1 Tax=Syncephalis pseudoplumigaleata TaxID=1712513 RepID=A0A4P9Z3V9_9FUNG|nr:hypothetical protein SYNPS1DRAFT_27100 [Syncephalis pseudoplumigaleata]|eukprot:RKP27243.1 hypothetical protein SYNPS1DRAFT_27100 [Syncephalis pseudoplumigaleata]
MPLPHLPLILSIIVVVQSAALTSHAAPAPFILPKYGILDLPNGDRYMFAKITNAPEFELAQWGSLLDGKAGSATGYPSDASAADKAGSIAIPVGQAKLGSFDPSADDSSSNSNNGGSSTSMKNITNSVVSTGKQSVRNQSDAISDKAALTAGGAATAAAAPVLGPLAPVAGVAVSKVTKSVVESTINRCTEPDATAWCFIKPAKSDPSSK